MESTYEHVRDQVDLVRQGWHTFTRGSNPGRSVRLSILQSWERSVQATVNPGQPGGRILFSDHDVTSLLTQNRDLISAASPSIAELGAILRETCQVVTLCDPLARPLLIEGDSPSRRAAEKINLVPGSDWREEISGTNAMGTALAEGRMVTVFATEHYLEGLHAWACVAAPIRHPMTGEIAGILDLSGQHMLVNRHTEATVSQAAHAIEVRLALLESVYRQALADAFADLISRGRMAAVGVVNRHGALLRSFGTALSQPIRQDLLFRGTQHILKGADEHVEEAEVAGRRIRLTFRPVRLGESLAGSAVEASVLGGSSTPDRERSAELKGLVGANPAWLQSLDRAGRAARTDSTILVTGETGTGKEVLARAIHGASRRARGPFVPINCGALPPQLATSELFGYVGGAFTGANPKGHPGKVETAHGGTLFLDEVSELTLEAQVLLLRVLQEREVVRVGSHHPVPVDVRVVAASNKDLGELVARGAFRQDLFFRLNVVPVRLPPLRERREDILPLLEHAYRRLGLEAPPLGLGSCEKLAAYNWPGNVRELFNVVEQAVALDEDPADLLPLPALAGTGTPLVTLGEAGEEDRIRRALDESGGNAAQAARDLGMSRSTLYRKLEQYGIRLARQVR